MLSHLKQEEQQDIKLDQIGFLRKFIRHLSGTLEDIVGLHEASGFMATVAQRLGEQMNEAYKASLELERMSIEQVCRAIEDIEGRINCDFQIANHDDEKIVVTHCVCPFGKDVTDRPSLCMMTSNMLGVIAAENLGYTKVSIEESIARGDKACRIVMYLKNTDAAKSAGGQEFFQS